MSFARKLAILFILSSLLLSSISPGGVLLASPQPLAIGQEPFALPEAKVGVEYEHQFQSEGGLAPLTWRVTEGSLPPGTKLEPSGKLHGMPTQAQRDGYAFMMEVSDSSKTPQRATMPFVLVVRAAPLRIITTPGLSIIPPSAGRPSGTGNVPAQTTPPAQPNSSNTTPSDNLRASIDDSAPSVSPAPRTLQAALTSPPSASTPPVATSTTTPTAPPTPTPPAAPTPTPITVCGKIRPASLDRTLAWIREANLQDKVVEYNSQSGSQLKPNFLASEKKEIRGRFETPISVRLGRIDLDTLVKGTQSDDCSKIGNHAPGEQKAAAIHVLRDALLALQDGPKKFKAPKQAITSMPGEQEFDSLSAEAIERQILLLEEYMGKLRVVITNGKGEWQAEDSTDEDGNYKLTFSAIPNEEYTVTTDADNHYTKMKFRPHNRNAVKINIPIEDRPVSLLTRTVVGLQQSGAAATENKWNIFADLFISKTIPWRQTIHPDFGERFRAWSATRILSAPQSGDATIGETVGGFATTVTGLKVKDAARIFDFLGGIEYRLSGNNGLLPSFDRQTKQKFSLSFIASLGFVTPEDPKLGIFKYNVFDDAPGLPPEAKGKKFVAFVPSDRDRFYRQYYAGLRIQTFFFNRHNIPLQRFPAQFDFTIGQNEYVSGGLLRGPIFRVDGYFPLPYDDWKFINIYGTAFLRPAHVNTSTPLLLEPVSGNPQTNFVPDKDTVIIPVRQFDRDYYKVGVGIDLFSLVQTIKNRQRIANQPNTTAAQPSTP